MKKPILSLFTALVGCAIASSSFARNGEQKAPTGSDPELRKEVDEVRSMAHRLQGELSFPGSDRLFHEEVFEIDRDVSHFNSAVNAHKYSREQARLEVERIRAEFLNLERELKQKAELKARVSP
jgi:hypothetical protein